ncbi:MAG: pyrophosphatase, partial [Pedobacter sp.]|nr:pyrophosphatase [Pedobacter sp.]
KSDEEVDLGEEMADVLFVLICLANQTGINLTDALEKNLEKKSIRDANRHKDNPKLQ